MIKSRSFLSQEINRSQRQNTKFLIHATYQYFSLFFTNTLLSPVFCLAGWRQRVILLPTVGLTLSAASSSTPLSRDLTATVDSAGLKNRPLREPAILQGCGQALNSSLLWSFIRTTVCSVSDGCMGLRHMPSC